MLAADAMLALDEAGQRQAARALSGKSEANAELCALLGACAAEGIAPQT